MSTSAYRFIRTRNLTEIMNNIVGQGNQLDKLGDIIVNKDKIDPLYTIYAPVLLDSYVPTTFGSRFLVSKGEYNLQGSDDPCKVIVDSSIKPQHRYTNCSPRFCIIDSNYQNIEEGTVWLKKYPQSPVSIKTKISGGVMYDDEVTFFAPIVRIFITKQKQ